MKFVFIKLGRGSEMVLNFKEEDIILTQQITNKFELRKYKKYD